LQLLHRFLEVLAVVEELEERAQHLICLGLLPLETGKIFSRRVRLSELPKHLLVDFHPRLEGLDCFRPKIFLNLCPAQRDEFVIPLNLKMDWLPL